MKPSTTRRNRLHARAQVGLCLLLLTPACGGEGDDEFGTVGQALEPECAAVTIQAEEMTHSVGGPAPGGWNIWSNGSISKSHEFGTGNTTITVRARGQQALGIFPHMVIRVGGVAIGNATVGSTGFADYAFSFDATAGTKVLSITFDNDYYRPPADRNLIVDSVTIGCPLPLTGQLALSTDWGAGYCMTLGLTNHGTEATTGWEAVMDLRGTEIVDLWGAELTATSGETTLSSLGWSSVIQPGETSRSVGFCASRPLGGNALPRLISVSSGSAPGEGGLIWPIDCVPGEACSTGIGCPDVIGNSACGAPSYSGHQGTDIGITQEAQDAGTAVWAAADGEVLWTFDGKYDQCPNDNEPDCQDPGYVVCTPEGPYCGTKGCPAFLPHATIT
jgi:hypothetical protein